MWWQSLPHSLGCAGLPAAAVLPAEFRIKARSLETGVLPAGLSGALGKLRYHAKRKHGRVKHVLGSLYFPFLDDKTYVKRGCGETDMKSTLQHASLYNLLYTEVKPWFYTVKIARWCVGTFCPI